MNMEFKIPIKAFMRDIVRKNQSTGLCKFLVVNVGDDDYTDGIILGDVFFQQFEATFSLDTSKVTLQLQQNVVNGADLTNLI